MCPEHGQRHLAAGIEGQSKEIPSDLACGEARRLLMGGGCKGRMNSCRSSDKKIHKVELRDGSRLGEKLRRERNPSPRTGHVTSAFQRRLGG